MNKIFECIVGSYIYGTQIEGVSDKDYKGVYLQDNKDILGLRYQEQLNPDKDTTYYEIRRFIELLGSANPSVLEMLFVDDKFIKVSSYDFDALREFKKVFLTKKCLNSFGGYAVQQIKKAKGLDKKINWEVEKTIRKEPIDFCYIQSGQGSELVKSWLSKTGKSPEFCGIQAITHMPNCYLLYYDYGAQYGKDSNNSDAFESFGYKGFGFEDSNALRLSSIPKEQKEQHIGIFYYNPDSYSIHCKDYKSYTAWLEHRNTDRYIQTKNQVIDGKNMMHCMRLIDCATEIGQTGNLTVFRPNADYLVSIRQGKVDLVELIEIAESKIKDLDLIYANCDLPEDVSFDIKHQLILNFR